MTNECHDGLSRPSIELHREKEKFCWKDIAGNLNSEHFYHVITVDIHNCIRYIISRKVWRQLLSRITVDINNFSMHIISRKVCRQLLLGSNLIWVECTFKTWTYLIINNNNSKIVYKPLNKTNVSLVYL